MDRAAESPTSRWLHLVWWIAGLVVLVVFTAILVVLVRVSQRAALEARFAAYGATIYGSKVGPDWLRNTVGARTMDAFGRVEWVHFGADPMSPVRQPPPRALDDESLRGLVDELVMQHDLVGVSLLPPARVGDRGFLELRRLRQLRNVRVEQCPVTDAALDGVAADWPRLEGLVLSNTEIGDRAAAEISRLPNLERLDLDGTSVGDEGAAQLATTPRLLWLSLTQTYVTEQGIATLVARIPGLQVSDD